MSPLKQPELSPDQRKKIEQKLLSVFKDVCFNNPSILGAKSESDHISEEIRKFILNYAESTRGLNEADLLLKAKEKGLELVETHDLVFFEEDIDRKLKMRAFLIPGMRVEFTEENAHEKVTEDDLQSIDHELCISFKVNDKNEFVKLGNLLDIRANLARALSNKPLDDEEVDGLIRESSSFKDSLKGVVQSAANILLF